MNNRRCIPVKHTHTQSGTLAHNYCGGNLPVLRTLQTTIDNDYPHGNRDYVMCTFYRVNAVSV